MASLIYKELAYKVVGCAMEVHKVLGPGFLEAAYENAMKIELKILGLKYSAQVPYPIIYKGVHIKDYVCDLVVDDKTGGCRTSSNNKLPESHKLETGIAY